MDPKRSLEIDRLRSEIEATRASISRTASELRWKAGEAMQWQTYVRRHPVPILAAAALVGLAVGRRVARGFESGAPHGSGHGWTSSAAGMDTMARLPARPEGQAPPLDVMTCVLASTGLADRRTGEPDHRRRCRRGGAQWSCPHWSAGWKRSLAAGRPRPASGPPTTARALAQKGDRHEPHEARSTHHRGPGALPPGRARSDPGVAAGCRHGEPARPRARASRTCRCIAAETLHTEIQVALMDRRTQQATQIQDALIRLSDGRYGFCQECEEFIGVPRLRALPFAQRCRDCQGQAERRARRRRCACSRGACARSRSRRPDGVPRRSTPRPVKNRARVWDC